MALSRNARRLNAKLRAGRVACDAANSAMVRERQATVRANLSNPRRGERTKVGLVSSIYSATAKPVGFSHPLRWTKGAANVGNHNVT
jgi:hypothetical protein